MFDIERPADASTTLSVVEAAQRLVVEQECRILVLAAHWADLNATEVVDGDGVVRPASAGPETALAGRSRRPGGAGTPVVSEFTAAELGAVLATTTSAAWALIADAVDLRHRLPSLWAVVLAGGVRVWKVRRVAQATRHLSLPAAAAVDAAAARVIAGVPWGRFERILEAEIIHADPADAAERARVWEAQRFVRGTRSAAGLRTLVARASAGDVVWFLAMVARIADILAADGDLDSVDVRRSKAIGILAQPAVALQLLLDHAAPDDHSDSAHHDGPVDDHLSLDLGADPISMVGVDDTDELRRARETGRARRMARAVRPPVTLYVHLTDHALRDGTGVARIEGEAPVTVGQVRDWLGRVDVRITIKPVLDPGAVAPVDAWEIPAGMREAVRLRQPADVFPWGTNTGRQLDVDHTVPYRLMSRGGPTGQTRVDNLGPLSRSHHRAKTFGRWRLRQPEPGHYLWRSPYGWVFHVTSAGTQKVGHGAFAKAVWDAARASPSDAGRVA